MGNLKDRFGRILKYVRISVTDRCNYRCRYCMPAEGVDLLPHESVLSYEDIFFLTDVLQELGVEKIRFTGGEPFVRPDFPEFLSSFAKLFPDLRLALTTNGSLLEKYSDIVVNSGINAINVSLDTLSAEKFEFITRSGNLEDVINGLDAVSGGKNLNIRLNTVLIRGFNEEEVGDIIDFAGSKGIIPRFIEFMPVNGDLWSGDAFISASSIFETLPEKGKWQPVKFKEDDNPGPAKYYRKISSGQVVGIIAAISDHFCQNCNRLRVTSTGEMRPCLLNDIGVGLLEYIREKDRQKVKEGIFQAVEMKPGGWEISNSRKDNMSKIGG